MKKLCLLSLILLTGCSVAINKSNDYYNIINEVILSNSNIINQTSKGYKYYIPKGVTLLYDNDLNQKFKVNNTYMYLYTDVISYYYEKNDNYKNDEENLFYYKDITTTKSGGYIKIKEENNQFYVEIVYNYAKIEMYSSKYNLKNNITFATIILSSIDYNKTTIESLINKNYFSNYEHKYVLKKPKDSESNFLEYSEEYNTYEDDTLPDDKSITNEDNNE